MKRGIALAIFLMVASIQAGAVYAMNSASFEINWDSVNSGGDDISQSTNYQMTDTLGEGAAGTGTSAGFVASAGYRAVGPADTLGLIFKTQEADRKSSYSGLNIAGKTVTLSAPSADFLTNDYIAVVENEGYGEWVSVGKVSQIVGAVITVDQFAGAAGTMSALPAGGNDYVYRLRGTSLAFGSVASSRENVAVAVASVASTVPSGYTLSISANQGLTNGAYTIPDPTAAVALGDEEYGASVTGTQAYLPDTDFGLSGAVRVIQIATDATGADQNRLAIIAKLGITATTPVGAYGQNLYYTLTANY